MESRLAEAERPQLQEVNTLTLGARSWLLVLIQEGKSHPIRAVVSAHTSVKTQRTSSGREHESGYLITAGMYWK